MRALGGELTISMVNSFCMFLSLKNGGNPSINSQDSQCLLIWGWHENQVVCELFELQFLHPSYHHIDNFLVDVPLSFLLCLYGFVWK